MALTSSGLKLVKLALTVQLDLLYLKIYFGNLLVGIIRQFGYLAILKLQRNGLFLYSRNLRIVTVLNTKNLLIKSIYLRVAFSSDGVYLLLSRSCIGLLLRCYGRSAWLTKRRTTRGTHQILS